MGPITLFDKSFLQSLSLNEAIWFDNFFLSVVSPLFYVETLADLDKAAREGRTPEQEVGLIADKFPEMHGTPSAYHVPICVSNLMGQSIPMEGRIMVPEARAVKHGDRTGILIDQSRELKAFERWQQRQFLEVERLFASEWRRQIAGLDLKALTQRLVELGIGTKRCTDLREARLVSGDFVHDRANGIQKLQLLALSLGIPYPVTAQIIHRWLESGRPALDEYAPYAAYVLTVEVFFYLGLAASLISPDRASNRVDISYLFYLPFAMVFVSNDNLHRRCAPLFLREDQEFVWGSDLKGALVNLEEHYRSLPASITDKGIYSFAAYPPEDDSSLVVQLWDRHLVPAWREHRKIESQPKKNLGPEFIDEMKQLIDAPTIPAAQLDFDSDSADAMIVARKVHKKKGDWYQLPKDFEVKNREADY